MTAELARGSAEVSLADRSIDDLDFEIRRLARQMNVESYRMLVLVRDFDDRFGFARWGLRSCAEWLAWSCGLSLSAAREKVRTAQALRNLPAISAAFADGRLSYSKVRALTRVVAPQDEDLLLAYGLEATVSQVEERCRQMRNVGPESVHAARRAWEQRSLTLFRDRARGVVRITIELPEADGELVGQAIESAVAAGDAAFGVEFAASAERSADAWRAQQADALVAIVKAYLAPPESARSIRTTSAADHYQVVLHVDEHALRGGIGRSDLPIETVKRLCCDGSVITIVEDDRGTPLDVGRKQRTVSTPLKRALWARDRGCSFPGCHKTRYVDAHHIHHWADGGDTSLENLTLLCTHHHTLLHEGGFTIHRDSTGGIFYRRLDGRVIPRSGYRSDDMLDDVQVALPGDNPSAEVRMAAIVHACELDDDAPAAQGLMTAGASESACRTSEGRRAACTVAVQNPSREGFTMTTNERRGAAPGPRTLVQSVPGQSAEVRETRGIYRIHTVAT
jgi:hypothetical protein